VPIFTTHDPEYSLSKLGLPQLGHELARPHSLLRNTSDTTPHSRHLKSYIGTSYLLSVKMLDWLILCIDLPIGETPLQIQPESVI